MNLPNYKDAQKRKKNYQRIEYKADKDLKNKYSNKTYHIKTYGCQMNEHDTENIKAMLEELGFKEEKNMEDSDLVLLNTCSIRENAHNKAYGMLGRLKHIKETKKDLIVGICGCMAQEEGVINEILDNYKWVNFVIGTHNLYNLSKVIEESIEKNKQEIEVFSKEGDLIEGMPVKRANNYKAYVNIIYGCDKFCTYCIVPYTRGGERSRKKEDILKEINELVKDGFKEVTLLGQNVNAYGKDLYKDYGLGELLEDVAKTNIPRIRFITSHPWDFSDHMIDLIAKYDNIMPSIHLPLQSGSSKILKLMGRRYSKESYLELVKKIKNKIPNISLSTDIIVGFPQETEEDFKETLEVAEICKYDNAFTFIYSPRENTPAAKLKDDITLEEKEKRLYKLNDLVNKYFLENNKKLIGTTEEVLIEGLSEKHNGKYYGYTKSNKLINVIGENIEIGSIVEVEITDAKTWSLDGKLLNR
ncbi:MAG: tRNA (N6-isopentenyl adenosine(37)-C2)-methylthiotransferase MiaB [Bacilli bacterium]|nr:tRNA (N6-isopentenyl adenosine(37)-C2)-methylthiotransferase MiaB [Bacilli bacterium]